MLNVNNKHSLMRVLFLRITSYRCAVGLFTLRYLLGCCRYHVLARRLANSSYRCSKKRGESEDFHLHSLNNVDVIVHMPFSPSQTYTMMVNMLRQTAFITCYHHLFAAVVRNNVCRNSTACWMSLLCALDRCVPQNDGMNRNSHVANERWMPRHTQVCRFGWIH